MFREGCLSVHVLYFSTCYYSAFWLSFQNLKPKIPPREVNFFHLWKIGHGVCPEVTTAQNMSLELTGTPGFRKLWIYIITYSVIIKAMGDGVLDPSLILL